MSAYAAEKHLKLFLSFLRLVTCSLSFLDLPLYSAAQKVNILLVNKNENTDAVFCICIKRDSKATNRNLGFANARYFPGSLLII